MAGKFAKRIEEEEIDKGSTCEWLKRGIMNYDNEKIILVAHDGRLFTIGIRKIFKCRFCQDSVATVNPLVSGYLKLLAERRYTTRNNNVCRVIQWKLCQDYSFQTPDVSWKQNPQPLLEMAEKRMTLLYQHLDMLLIVQYEQI